MIKKISLFLFCLTLCGPLYAEKRGAIDFQLVKIEKIVSGSSIIDTINISNEINHLGLNVTTYSDPMFKISWMYNLTNLDFVLKNTSNESLKIFWDEMSYIDISNNGHRVFHKGISPNKKEKSQIPTVIMKGTNLVDGITPVDYVSYHTGLERWLFYYLHTPKGPIHGREVKVLMVLRVNKSIVEYIFTFKIRNLNKRINVTMLSDYRWTYR